MKKPIKITGLGAIGSFGIGVSNLLQATVENFSLTHSLNYLTIKPTLAKSAIQSLRRSFGNKQI
jgi:hypothetical protein